MNANPYLAPQARVDVDPSAAGVSFAGGAPLFAVSTTKLVVMSIATLGLYQFYWMYKHWQSIRTQSGEDISPFWRAFFGIFFINQLFTRMRAQTVSGGVEAGASTGGLAAGYIISNILGQVLSRLRYPGLGIFVGMLSVVPIVIMQGEVNSYIDAVYPTADRNGRFSPANIVLIILGALFWALVMIGLLFGAKA